MTIQRGEIYFVNLNPVQGREQAGQRPVLILTRLKSLEQELNNCTSLTMIAHPNWTQHPQNDSRGSRIVQ